MKSLYSILLSMILFASHTLASNKLKQLFDVGGTRTLSYEQKQMQVQKTPYNFFDPIYVDYPAINLDNNKNINVKAINTFMHYYSLNWLKTDSFKYEFLPFAYKALSENLDEYTQYNYRNKQLENTTPKLADIKPQILFWTGDVIAYQVIYEFYFELENDFRVEDLAFVKTYYLQLSTGKMLNFNALFAPAKLPQLWQTIGSNLNQIKLQNKAQINAFSWITTYEKSRYDEDEKEEEEIDNKPIATTKSSLISLSVNDIKHVYFKLTPFLVEFIIPPFASSFNDFKHMGVVVQMSPEEFISYLSPSYLLGNWFNPKPANILHGITLDKFYPISYLQLISPLEHKHQFLFNLPKGTSQQLLYQLNINKADTQLSLIRETQFDSLGHVIKHVFGEEKYSNWQYFTYDSLGNVVKEITNRGQQIDVERNFIYNTQNNLIESRFFSESYSPIVSQYFYRDTLVYEYKKLELFADIQSLNQTVKVHLFSKNLEALSEFELYKAPHYWYKYANGKQLAYYHLDYPNMDNQLYAYDSLGNLQTIISDNGRHTHNFTYVQSQLVSYTHYDSFRLTKEAKFFYDGQNRLISFEEKTEYHSNPRQFLIKYK